MHLPLDSEKLISIALLVEGVRLSISFVEKELSTLLSLSEDRSSRRLQEHRPPSLAMGLPREATPLAVKSVVSRIYTQSCQTTPRYFIVALVLILSYLTRIGTIVCFLVGTTYSVLPSSSHGPDFPPVNLLHDHFQPWLCALDVSRGNKHGDVKSVANEASLHRRFSSLQTDIN